MSCRQALNMHVHCSILTRATFLNSLKADVNSWIDTLGRLSLPCSDRSRACSLFCAEGHLMYVSSSDAATCVQHFPCLSNVLLIYTCWALGCIGIRCTLTASITQQALLLPFKTHLKRFAGATVQPGTAAMILMRRCEECFTLAALLGTAGNLCGPFPVSVSEWEF